MNRDTVLVLLESARANLKSTEALIVALIGEVAGERPQLTGERPQVTQGCPKCGSTAEPLDTTTGPVPSWMCGGCEHQWKETALPDPNPVEIG